MIEPLHVIEHVLPLQCWASLY